jgi:hypothetical protein
VDDIGSAGPRLRSVAAAPGSDYMYGGIPDGSVAPSDELFSVAPARTRGEGGGWSGDHEYVTPFGSFAEKMAKSRAQLDQLTARRQGLVDVNSSSHHLDGDE